MSFVRPRLTVVVGVRLVGLLLDGPFVSVTSGWPLDRFSSELVFSTGSLWPLIVLVQTIMFYGRF